MKLVICEKNIAARRIDYILSNQKTTSKNIGNIPVYEFIKDNELWEIIGLKGHIIKLDYPAKYNIWKEISPRDLIEVEPCKKIIGKGIELALKSLVKKNPFIIIATDFDREGELIGVEVLDLIKTFNKDIDLVKRARFSSITRNEIEKTFNNLEEVDYNLSNAGEARQTIDLIWGAVLTRFISLTSQRLGKDFLSIGRVQSPTLAILVNREKEIKNFEPKKFWKIISKLKKKSFFDAIYCEEQIWDQQKAKRIYEKIKNCKQAIVTKYKKEIVEELPPSPFNTTSFLQAASYIGISTSKAMNIAEELYMSGLISYPRTDNTVYPLSLNIRNILEKLLKSTFSKEALEIINNGRKKPTRGKKLTTDHPPIHPVGVPSSGRLNPDQEKIYELVCRRFLATLAKNAISETIDVNFDISGEKFKTNGHRLIEPNWKKIYKYYKEKRKPIPELNAGEKSEIIKTEIKESKTQPPKRYSQGSLISKTEQLLLGTKSTRHEIINKLYSRKYISGKSLIPTSTAIAVIDALENCDVIKPKMTAILEEDMNLIVEGKKTLDDTVKESRQMLIKTIDSLEKDKEKIRSNIKDAEKERKTIGKCPRCNNDMVIRLSKQGKRFVGCTGFPKCNNTYPLPQDGFIRKTGRDCNRCHTPIVNIKTKGKNAWNLCLNPECPNKKKNYTK